jgi:acyl-CoA reductase-like NAD-dependent aldehyde dehydrogenase
MNIINPATEELISIVEVDTVQSIQEKFVRLQEGQVEWAATALTARIAAIARFCDLLEEKKEELAKTLTSEMGKPLQQSYNELNGARNRIRFFVDHAAQYLAEEWIITEGATREKITYEPLGVIANISAWNYPYLVGVNVFIPALIAGNAVCYKPSEYATLTGLQIRDLLYEAGIPQHCFQTAMVRVMWARYCYNFLSTVIFLPVVMLQVNILPKGWRIN